MPDHLLQSIPTFATSIDADPRSVRRHLQTGAIPLQQHRIGGMVRISVSEARAWIAAGSPSRDQGWEWPKVDDDMNALRMRA